MVLTSALATKIRWSTPFDAADEPLGGVFSQARQVLSSKAQHDVYLADTAAAGQVAVHTAWSDGNLRVLSVIAEPGRAVGDVHRAALDAVTRQGRVDLFDAPLGAGHTWTLDESLQTTTSHDDRLTTAHAHLPAWDATTDVDLGGEPWFAAVAATVGAWTSEPRGLEGLQSAVASYDRTGFSAAAVTVFAARTGAAFREPREVRVRHLEVRFDRPYAVVAVADQRYELPEASQVSCRVLGCREDEHMPKRIDEQVKARVVRLVAEHLDQYPTATAAMIAVAAQEGVSRESVRRWVAQAEVDAGTREGRTSAELAQIKDLKARVRRLESDNAILKAATVFFAGELDPRNR